MKYRNTYLRELEKYRKKAIDIGGLKGDFSNEWFIIASAMKYPSCKPEQMVEKIKKDFDITISVEDVCGYQRKTNLASFQKRKEQSRIAVENTMSFRRLIDGDETVVIPLKNALDKLIDTFDESGRKIFPSKCTLCYMLIYDNELWCKEDSRIIVKNFMDLLCRRTLESIFESVVSKMGVDVEVSAGDGTSKSIENTIKHLRSKTEDLVDIDTAEDKDKKIELLTFNVQNLKAALEVATNSLNELKASIQDSAEEARLRTITDFYKGLNSKEYGSILDNLIYVEQVLNKYRRERIKFEGELNSITVILKQIIRFIKSQQLSSILPIEDIGKTIEVVDSDLIDYEYIGELFRDNEVKSVEIVSPGWKYGDNIVISYPIVREKGM